MPYYNQRNYYRPSMFGGFSFFPPVIKWLLIINGGVYILTEFLGSFRLGDVYLGRLIEQYFGLMPFGSGHFYIWQLVTYQFLHTGFWHLFFNMFFGLWMFGLEIEHLWGSKKFLFYYLLCGVAAGITQLALAPIFEPTSLYDVYGRAVPTVGASGAIYGVLLAFGMLFPDRYIYIYFLIPVKAKYLMAFLIVIGVISVGGESNVAHLAHLGGVIAGFAYLINDRRHLKSSSMFDKAQQIFDTFRRQKQTDTTYYHSEKEKTTIYDIHNAKSKDVPPKTEQEKLQERIDEILDKISRTGYQSLTDEEKWILFDASKKIN